jgi:hypothetical protein
MSTKHVISYNILPMEFMILDLHKHHENFQLKQTKKSSFTNKSNSLPSIEVYKSHPPDSASILIRNDDTTS